MEEHVPWTCLLSLFRTFTHLWSGGEWNWWQWPTRLVLHCATSPPPFCNTQQQAIDMCWSCDQLGLITSFHSPITPCVVSLVSPAHLRLFFFFSFFLGGGGGGGGSGVFSINYLWRPHSCIPIKLKKCWRDTPQFILVGRELFNTHGVNIIVERAWVQVADAKDTPPPWASDARLHEIGVEHIYTN